MKKKVLLKIIRSWVSQKGFVMEEEKVTKNLFLLLIIEDEEVVFSVYFHYKPKKGTVKLFFFDEFQYLAGADAPYYVANTALFQSSNSEIGAFVMERFMSNHIIFSVGFRVILPLSTITPEKVIEALEEGSQFYLNLSKEVEKQEGQLPPFIFPSQQSHTI